MPRRYKRAEQSLGHHPVCHAAARRRRFDLERSKMSGSILSSSALDERRRRILFRAWRRGTREMDLVMGRFADAHLPTMSESELDAFELLLDVSDPQVLAWIMGGEAPPPEFDMALLARLRGPSCEAPERAERSAEESP